MRTLMTTLAWTVILVTFAFGATRQEPNAQANSAAADHDSPTLYLYDGDFFGGSLRDCPTPNVIRWLADGAAQPFEFGSEAIRAAYFASPKERPAPEGEYCFELSDGDVLYGSLAGITADQIQVQSAQFGRLQIARPEVLRITSCKSETFEYKGPNGLAEWKLGAENQWREEAGRILTNVRGATASKEIAIPEQARIEFEIAWEKSPQFTLAFCSSNRKEQLDEGFRFEVWDRTLVLLRELKKDADVAVVTEIDSHADRVHLQALYDFPTGEFTVYGLDGKQLAKITVPKKDGGRPLRSVWLINGSSDMRLEQLSVSRWNGYVPTQVDVDKPRIHESDGMIVYGTVLGYDADAKEFRVQTSAEELRIKSDKVACVVATTNEKFVPSAFRIGLHDGSRFSGDLAKTDGNKLYVQRRGVDQPLICATASIRSLVGLKRDVQSPAVVKYRAGRWESKGIWSHGALVEAPAGSDDNSSCLYWKPRYSTTSSALRKDISGRIVYRDPPPQAPKPSDQEQAVRLRPPVQRQAGFIGAVARVLGGDQPRVPLTGQGSLCLTTGDRIPCEVTQIDEEGVHFTSAVVNSKFVPNRVAKAVELLPQQWSSGALAEEKRLRLLTLPRMQKNNPPTHLIVSTNGDFLRGRLTAMTAETLSMETRLEAKQIPRDRVACIIWLHNEKEEKEAPGQPALPAAGLLVQAVQTNGQRLTFVPTTCDGTTISGASDVLGDCHFTLSNVDQLILGDMIQKTADEQPYGPWKLHDAVEPQFAQAPAEGAAGSQSAAAESGLIGKPAPDFQLELLDGNHFKLSEQKGHVVVLDFWASWCGPCMQAMPQVDKVAEELAGRGVKLVAVNMQEDAAAINAALERLKIAPTVALDIDGAAAERYQVSAIPQTVVIDAEGKVAALYIGANPGFADELRGAIEKLLLPADSPTK
jgi:thiol-disulfide isomerase/thioredoxin